MNTLYWIVGACVAGGVLSAVLAAGIAWSARAAWIPHLVSVAIGALLGAAFLETLPHAFSNASDIGAVAATVLAGIFGFFILEKLVLWRHHHIGAEEFAEAGGGDANPPVHGHAAAKAHGAGHGALHLHGHGHGHHHGPAIEAGGRSGLLIVVGDSFHNFVDGVLIAAAFLESPQLGVVTALAVVAHEIPQEIGDFVILLHSGYSRMGALLMNALSSVSMVVGGVLAYFALQAMEHMINTMLALSAASMIYVAVADLIPGLHQRTELRATLVQALLIAVGVGLIVGVGVLTGHQH
jgi:zinc and cadmium transporter